MRIAIVNKELCKSKKCSRECISVCPINRSGEKCVYLGDDEKSTIDESICIGCGLCVKKCPFLTIQVVNTPEKLKEEPIHRFGKNGFTLFRLPFPNKGEVVGLLGPNGVGKTTALMILSGDVQPNLGKEDSTDSKDIIKMFRGTELQEYLENLKDKKLETVVKPQKIDILSKIKGTVQEVIDEHKEKDEKEIIKLLKLENCLNRELNKLSGGELQRVAIAIAALRKADIYYFDEPSSYLDVFQRLEMGKIMRKLSEDASVMVVEHDLATLDFLADKIHVFYGVPGAYGIVSKPYSTRVGINAFLDGYIKEDNVRVRQDPIKFNIPRLHELSTSEVYLTWTDMEKKLGDFKLKVKSGNLYRGEILGVFGANGLGKTTLARIISGELKLDKGKINTEMKISYKPQYISSDFEGTVSELIETVIDKDDMEDFKNNILAPLGLERLMECSVKKLSGGELQRVSVAICLGKEANVYLLDEPSAFLDSEQRLKVAKLIRRHCERVEASAMIIDHDLLFLDYISDRALVFLGEQSMNGEAEEMELQKGFNEFLKQVDVTFRKDPQTFRPRANKLGSLKDREQKKKNKYFHVG